MAHALERITRLATVGALFTGTAAAQTTSDDWQFRAELYGYFPHIGGSASFPTGTSADIDIDPSDLIDNTHFAAMGAFEARKGRWGVFTDLIYLDIGDSIDDSTSLGAGSMPLPPGITADASLDVQGVVWSLAGSYRLTDTRYATVDAFAGVRLLDVETELDYAFNMDFGPFVGPARTGSSEADREVWDGIVGVKGRFDLGTRDGWFVPYYLDVGTGDSELTWQAATGIGYATSGIELFAQWRYLAYEFDSGAVDELDFSGLVLGIGVGW